MRPPMPWPESSVRAVRWPKSSAWIAGPRRQSRPTRVVRSEGATASFFFQLGSHNLQRVQRVQTASTASESVNTLKPIRQKPIKCTYALCYLSVCTLLKSVSTPVFRWHISRTYGLFSRIYAFFKRMYAFKKRKYAGFSVLRFRVHTVYFHGFTLSICKREYAL